MERNSLEDATPERLAKIAGDLAARAKELAADRAELEAELARRYPVPPAWTGTERRNDGDYEVKIEVPKKVEWDTDLLIAACNALEAAGGDLATPRNVREFVAWLRGHGVPVREEWQPPSRIG